MTYRTGGVNVHNRPYGVGEILRRGVDDAAFCETNRIQSAVRGIAKRSDARVTQMSHPGTDARRKNLYDNTIVTRNRHRSVGSICMQASDRSKPYRIAMERTVIAELSATPHGVIGRVALHPNYTGKAHTEARTPRVQENNELSLVLDQMLDLLAVRCDHIVASGDVNIAERDRTPGWMSPWEVFAKHDMKHRALDGSPIDAVFWTPSLELQRFETIDAKRLRTDHPGFVADFVPSRPRRR